MSVYVFVSNFVWFVEWIAEVGKGVLDAIDEGVSRGSSSRQSDKTNLISWPS